MKQLIKNYAQVLFELNIDHKIIEDTKKIFLESNELLNALSNPSVQKKEKHSVIDSIFDEAGFRCKKSLGKGRHRG